MLTGLWVPSAMAGEGQGRSGGHSHLQCKGYPHWVQLTAGSSKQPAEVVFHAAPLNPASALPMHPWLSASHQYPHWDRFYRPAHPLPPPAPWPPLGTLLTPSLWDHGCPLCPVAPAAPQMYPQRPTKTRIPPGTHAHPLPAIQDPSCMAPAWPCLQAVVCPRHGGVLSPPALPALLSPQELLGEPWPHLPAPHCSHGD